MHLYSILSQMIGFKFGNEISLMQLPKGLSFTHFFCLFVLIKIQELGIGIQLPEWGKIFLNSDPASQI